MALRSGAMLFSVLCIVIWWWMAQRSTLAQITASPTPCRPARACCAGTTSRKSVTDDVQAAIDNTQAVRYTGCTQNRMVTVAQLGRALDCGSSGCGFEPHRSPQDILKKASVTLLIICPLQINYASKSA